MPPTNSSARRTSTYQLEEGGAELYKLSREVAGLPELPIHAIKVEQHFRVTDLLEKLVMKIDGFALTSDESRTKRKRLILEAQALLAEADMYVYPGRKGERRAGSTSAPTANPAAATSDRAKADIPKTNFGVKDPGQMSAEEYQAYAKAQKAVKKQEEQAKKEQEMARIRSQYGLGKSDSSPKAEQKKALMSSDDFEKARAAKKAAGNARVNDRLAKAREAADAKEAAKPASAKAPSKISASDSPSKPKDKPLSAEEWQKQRAEEKARKAAEASGLPTKSPTPSKRSGSKSSIMSAAKSTIGLEGIDMSLESNKVALKAAQDALKGFGHDSSPPTPEAKPLSAQELEWQREKERQDFNAYNFLHGSPALHRYPPSKRSRSSGVSAKDMPADIDMSLESNKMALKAAQDALRGYGLPEEDVDEPEEQTAEELHREEKEKLRKARETHFTFAASKRDLTPCSDESDSSNYKKPTVKDDDDDGATQDGNEKVEDWRNAPAFPVPHRPKGSKAGSEKSKSEDKTETKKTDSVPDWRTMPSMPVSKTPDSPKTSREDKSAKKPASPSSSKSDAPKTFSFNTANLEAADITKMSAEEYQAYREALRAAGKEMPKPASKSKKKPSKSSAMEKDRFENELHKLTKKPGSEANSDASDEFDFKAREDLRKGNEWMDKLDRFEKEKKKGKSRVPPPGMPAEDYENWKRNPDSYVLPTSGSMLNPRETTPEKNDSSDDEPQQQSPPPRPPTNRPRKNQDFSDDETTQGPPSPPVNRPRKKQDYSDDEGRSTSKKWLPKPKQYEDDGAFIGSFDSSPPKRKMRLPPMGMPAEDYEKWKRDPEGYVVPVKGEEEEEASPKARSPARKQKPRKQEVPKSSFSRTDLEGQASPKRRSNARDESNAPQYSSSQPERRDPPPGSESRNGSIWDAEAPADMTGIEYLRYKKKMQDEQRQQSAASIGSRCEPRDRYSHDDDGSLRYNRNDGRYPCHSRNDREPPRESGDLGRNDSYSRDDRSSRTPVGPSREHSGPRKSWTPPISGRDHIECIRKGNGNGKEVGRRPWVEKWKAAHREHDEKAAELVQEWGAEEFEDKVRLIMNMMNKGSYERWKSRR